MLKKKIKQRKINNKSNSIQSTNQPISKSQIQQPLELCSLSYLLTLPIRTRKTQLPRLVERIRQFVNPFIQKKQGSRVVQLILKWAQKEDGQKIVKQICKQWRQGLRGKYSIYACKSAVKYYQEECIQTVLKHAVVLLMQPSVAKILSTLSYSSMNRLKNKVNELVMQKKVQISLKAVEYDYWNNAIIGKLVGESIPHMIQNQRNQVVQKLVQGIGMSKQEIRIYIEVVNYSTAKQKKMLVKQLKGKIRDLIQEQQNGADICILKLLLSVDDYVFTKKVILDQLINSFDLLANKKMYNIISGVFNQKHCILTTFEKQLKYTNTKKDHSKIRSQIIPFLINPLVQKFISLGIQSLAKQQKLCRLLGFICKYIILNNQQTQIIEWLFKQLRPKEPFNSCYLNQASYNKLLTSIFNLYSQASGKYLNLITKQMQIYKQLIENKKRCRSILDSRLGWIFVVIKRCIGLQGIKGFKDVKQEYKVLQND